MSKRANYGMSAQMQVIVQYCVEYIFAKIPTVWLLLWLVYVAVLSVLELVDLVVPGSLHLFETDHSIPPCSPYPILKSSIQNGISSTSSKFEQSW